MNLGAVLLRLLRAAGAGLTAAVIIAIGYAILDLYLSGHSIAVPTVRGRPLHGFVGNLLLLAVPVAVAVFVFWRDRPS